MLVKSDWIRAKGYKTFFLGIIDLFLIYLKNVLMLDSILCIKCPRFELVLRFVRFVIWTRYITAPVGGFSISLTKEVTG